MENFKAMSSKDKTRFIANWLLDHAMIIIIILMAIYVQTQKPAFFGVPSLVNIMSLTWPAVSCWPVRTFPAAAWLV